MSEILEGQQLEVDNLLSFRGKILQSELNQILLEMKSYVEEQGVKCIGNPITATFGVFNEDGHTKIDIEALVPIDETVVGNCKFSFKSKLLITNALVGKHIGNINMLQNTCDEINHHIIKEKLVPVTVGYNVTKKVDKINSENIEIHVYVGISTNVL